MICQCFYRFYFVLLFQVDCQDGIPLGICGLLKRDSLEDVDLGYAFLSKYQRKGYALEAAKATLVYSREYLGLQKIVAITSRKNIKSSSLLEKVGMEFDRMILLPDIQEELRLFTIIF